MGGLCSRSFSVISLLMGVFPVIFLREVVFKGEELGEEEDKERTSVREGFGEPSIIQQPCKALLPWAPVFRHP